MALQRDYREVEVKKAGPLGAQSQRLRVDAETLEAPYTGFFGRLRIPYKLALLIVPLLFPICYLLLTLVGEQRSDINLVRAGKQGVLFLQNTSDLLKAIADHRSLSVATLSGNQELAVARTLKAEEIGRNLQMLEQMNRAEGDPFGLQERLSTLRTRWDTLLAVRYGPSQSFQEHTQLIQELLRIHEQFAIGSGLILDPTARSYWLIDSVVYRIPLVVETLSQLQGIGTMVLQSKKLTPEQERRLNGLLASLDNRSTGLGEVPSVTASLEQSMRNALSNNPQLVSVLGEGMSPARAITASAVELTRRDVLSKRYTLEPSLYLDQLSRPIEAHFALQNAALNQLNDLLEARLAQLANQQTLSLFIVAATLLLSLWLIMGVANSILAPLRELTRVALNLGQGNLSTLAHLRSSDELGLVGKTLNQSILTLRSLMEQQEAERQRGLQLQENVRHFMAVAIEMAQGDLTKRGQVTQDVLGNVVEAVNLTIEEIGHLLKEVKQAAVSVNESAAQMDQLTASIAAGAQAQAREVSQVKNQTHLVASSIRQMAQSADSAAEAAGQTLASAQLGRQAVTQALSGMNSIREEIQTIAENIAVLAQRSAEIENITKVLEDFASQTNLLALNASFEAAGAGAAGRRFAIVADEIRKLAEESARETSRVSNLVQQVQSEIGRLVALVQEGVREVESGYNTAYSASGHLEDIAKLAEQSAQLAQQISSLVQSQVSAVEQVDQAVQKITQTAQRTEIESQAGRRAAETVRLLSQTLIKNLARFRLPEQEGA